jgi:hypothetical protein
LKSIYELSNLLAYIRIDDVLAVPLPPTKRQALTQIGDFGYVNIKLSNNSDLKESRVGINNYEKAKALPSGGFQSSG